MIFIDSHAHITDSRIIENIDPVLERAKDAKVEAIINICIDEQTLERGIELARKNPRIFNSAAVCPQEAHIEHALFFEALIQQAKKNGLVAIGETGLDYYYPNHDKEKQKTALLRHVALAKQYNLPLIFHCREAFEDLFRLNDQYFSGHPAMVHCFTGSLLEAKECLARGWYISISGILTFRNSNFLRKVVVEIPIEKLLLETDSPYLSPQGKRGKMNEPSYLIETAETVAILKDLSLTEVAHITSENAIQFFSLPKQILSV